MAGLSGLQALGSFAGGAAAGISQGADIAFQKKKLEIAQQAQIAEAEQIASAKRLASYMDLQKATVDAIANMGSEQSAAERSMGADDVGAPVPPEVQKQQLVRETAKIMAMFKNDPAIATRLQGDLSRLMSAPTGAEKQRRELEAKQQEERMKAEVKQEFEEVEPLGSDIIDESGNLKNEVSATLQRVITSDFALTDPVTQLPRRNLTPNETNIKNARTTLAAKILVNKDAKSIEEAAAMARSVIPFSGEPTGSVPEKTRNEMLGQNEEIRSLMTKQQEVLKASLEGTGLASNIPAFFDATLGQVIGWFSEGFTFSEENQQARQTLRIFNQDLKRSIVNSQRFPKWEQEIIVSMIPDPSSLTKNPGAAFIQTKMLFDYLQQKQKQNLEALGMKKIDKQPESLNSKVNSILGIENSPIPTLGNTP